MQYEDYYEIVLPKGYFELRKFCEILWSSENHLWVKVSWFLKKLSITATPSVNALFMYSFGKLFNN